ncbi:MAG: hydrogenase maturation nickel metallochaperone HypA [Anaerolineales bacterium]
MHEHDIVQRLFGIIARRLGNVRVVHIARGELFEFSEKSILAAWREFSMGKPLEKIELKFRLIRAEVQCMACFQKYHPEGGEIRCPHCGSFGAKVLKGDAIVLEDIET